MKLLLLANASAASVTPRVRVVIGELLAAEHDVTVAETSRRGHASRLAQGAAADGYEVVVVLGGDGTVNEAANGLVGSSTAMGLLPGGSTNVLARTLGFTNDPVKAAGELLLALRQPERSIRRIGLGRANGRYFLFHAGLGFDAAVVEQVEKRGSLKRFAGHPLFVYATILTWLRHFDRTRPHFDIVVVDGPEPGRKITGVYFAICLKTNPYTFLGNRPLNVSPEAGLDTGFSILAFKTLSLSTVAGVFTATLTGRGGPALARRRNIAYALDVNVLEVRGQVPFPYQLDGDYLGQVEQLELRFEPGLLRLVVPAT
ncbi:MAG: diacylglycerol kinase family lipid kinase [Actinomycetota bacterium]|nr:diacylglycerol kinase family lipid kinase [Actinomycetota bacterium]